jgi:polyphosphate kinase
MNSAKITPEPASEPAAASTLDLRDPSLYLNRELSWLAFNQRVLQQARDASHPLLERVKFLAITANNLDEFYMVRFAGLLRQRRACVEKPSIDGLHIDAQVSRVRRVSERMIADIGSTWTTLAKELEAHDIFFVEPEEYTPEILAFLKQHFSAMICPVLTPLAFDPGHPFPYVSNRSRNLAVVVRHRGQTKFARVKVPDTLARFIELPAELTMGTRTFAYLEDVIKANLRELFPGVKIVSAHLFRVIRDSDIVVHHRETDDLRESVHRGLRQGRHGAISLMEVEADMPKRVLDILTENFEIEPDVQLRSRARMGFADWMALHRLHGPGLKDEPFRPRTMMWRRASGLPSGDFLFDELKYHDCLIHHPFDSFTPVETFLQTAVRDPQIIAIKMTLYRIGTNSPLVDLLIEAADNGKQVAVLVELKARFDERRNMAWATRMEEAGVHVVYGMPKLKTHAKLCLIVRKGPDGIERYAHISTGNYNGATAQTYTDLGLFSSDPRLMADITELFNYLTGYSNQVLYRDLLVAPITLRKRLRQMLAREAAHAEAGRPARVIIKVNSLSDPALIRDLYRTSRAGVRIDLIVRGICCLRPGVPGVSDTITVRSLVGRFLEHSRIFHFANGGTPDVFIGSADLMERNLNRRVETLCPIRDVALQQYLRETVLESYLRDSQRTTMLNADGEYERVEPPDGEPRFDAQRYLLRHAPPCGAGAGAGDLA